LWPSIFILAYAIIGGVGSVFGPVAAATIGVLGIEALRATEGLQGVLLGVALIIVGLAMPGGLTSVLSEPTGERLRRLVRSVSRGGAGVRATKKKGRHAD
jgi:ABC-type branched-subunit amino acid transport system permease subunit